MQFNKKTISLYKSLLDELVEKYNQPFFIQDDPISLPHQFKVKQDIEIAGFFAAILAWGQRKTIIKNCNSLFSQMDNEPWQFVLHHSKSERKRFQNFVHRTFQFDDLNYFLTFLQFHYQNETSLETAFVRNGKFISIYDSLHHFKEYFFSLPHLNRTEKHIQTPVKKSACKRLNLFLRWMVRKDSNGVDFGIWNSIPMHALICPLDVHVQREAIELGILKRTKIDFEAALELTSKLLLMDKNDPIKYDFALFGLGIEKGLTKKLKSEV